LQDSVTQHSRLLAQKIIYNLMKYHRNVTLVNQNTIVNNTKRKTNNWC